MSIPGNTITNVLVIWDQPEDFKDLLEDRFPALNFRFASQCAAVRSALAESPPEVVFSINSERFPAETHRLAAGHPGVQWVQVGGSGYDHLHPVDLSRFTLTNSAGVLARYLAETVTGAMLALNGKFFVYRRQQQEQVWQAIPFRPLCEQSVLVVGVGEIGARVAANAKALGMRVLGVKRSATKHPSVDRMFALKQLHSALPEADFVSLHLRLSGDTKQLFGRKAIGCMKQGAYLINTARGPIVDTGALLQAIRSRRLSGAWLDVFEKEPLPAEDPLWDLDNVVITPHTADQVHHWPRRFAEFFADNLDRRLRNLPLRNEV